MNKIVLMLAVLLLILSFFFFFIQKNLLIGSFVLILTFIFNLIYAMLFKINELSDEDLKE